jgi:hypothetical protein
VDTRANSRDVSWGGLSGHDCGLGGDSCWLSGLSGNSCGLAGLRGSDREHARDDTKGVGLSEQGGLGEGIDRGL